MNRTKLIQTGAAWLCGAALAAVGMGGGQAQPAGPPVQKAVTAPIQSDVTTVSPLTVSPLAPIPKVGAGAPYFMPDELNATHDATVSEERITRWGLEDMRPIGHAPKLERFTGDFSLEALCDTANTVQLRLIETSEAAARATQAALDARTAAAQQSGRYGGATSQQLESTELARQNAVNDYLAARAAAQEADARVTDYRNLPRQELTSPGVLPSEVERRTIERNANGGVIGAPEFADLTVSDVVAHERPGGKDMVLLVTGRIGNPRKSAIADPPLTISLLDKAGFVLSSAEYRAPKKERIPAGGSIAFSYEVPSPAPFALAAAVTFASSRRISPTSLTGCQIRRRA